ncbi:MAG: hypothetical protein CVU41_18955 [Chloroflexi bacterium HGW-Chloroflexi-3]|nr:MAG: hypothetical protein CVU41_18955 [Chloroflexi bacterium HGW-Chloroflexi-3]
MKNSWEHKKLGEVITLEYGKPLLPDQRKSDGKYPVYGANGIKDRTDKFFYDRPSIIIGRKGSAGEINLTNEKFWPLDVTYFVVYEPKKYDRKFLFYLLRILQLHKLAKGVKPGINRNDVYAIEVDIPPLREQQRIVDILDQSFAAIDQVIENTASNKENSKDIYEAYIDNIFDSLIKNHPTKKLNEICIIRPPKNEAKEKLNESSMVSFAPMEDLGINQKFLIPEREKKLLDVYSSYTYFAENDVLLAKITPCFENGKLGIARNLLNSIGFGSSEYIVFRPSTDLRSEFLYYFLSREKFRNEGIKHMQGAVGHKRVALDFVSNHLIPIPSLLQQDEIINKIDNFFDQSYSLRSNYENKIDLLQELKQSILHRAFNGEL